MIVLYILYYILASHYAHVPAIIAILALLPTFKFVPSVASHPRPLPCVSKQISLMGFPAEYIITKP